MDTEDIKRLGKEFKWIPGPCAYCNGKGTVRKSMIKKIPVDTTYLSTDLVSSERTRLISGDKAALERAEYFEIQTEAMLEQIHFLHTSANLDSKSIAEFYSIADQQLKRDQVAFDDFVEYVEQILSKKNNANKA